jgi:hypothetical protein
MANIRSTIKAAYIGSSISNVIIISILILVIISLADGVMDQNDVLAQGNNSASPTRDLIVDIIIPLLTGLGGAGIGVFGGYRLSNRSQFKFNKIEQLFKSSEVYLDIIRNIDTMLNNPEFLNTVEDPQKIYDTIKEIGDEKKQLIDRSEFMEYMKWRQNVKGLTTQDVNYHKVFGEKGQSFRNSLVRRYNLIINEYNKLTNEKKSPEPEDNRKLIINDRSDNFEFGQRTWLEWVD